MKKEISVMVASGVEVKAIQYDLKCGFLAYNNFTGLTISGYPNLQNPLKPGSPPKPAFSQTLCLVFSSLEVNGLCDASWRTTTAPSFSMRLARWGWSRAAWIQSLLMSWRLDVRGLEIRAMSLGEQRDC